MIVRQQFAQMESFAIYYGTDAIDTLADYDVVVLEPSNHSADDIVRLKQSGTLVLAYVSVMETGKHHVLWPKVDADMLLRDNGVPLRQEVYDTYLMDLTSVKWKGLLSRHVGELMAKWKYDGLFLDTIGDIERPSLPKQSEQLHAAATLVEQLRRWFPDAVLVQNNGLEMVCLKTAPMLDGIVWENPPLGQKEADGWVARIVERMEQLRQTYHVRPMVLFEGVENISRKDWILRSRFADQNHYVSYFAPTHYTGDINRWQSMR